MRLLFAIFFLLMTPLTYAGTPLWTFTPLTATTIVIPDNTTAIVQYMVTNQSRKTHTLRMQAIPGITQLAGIGLCSNPFTLNGNASCVLSLQINSNTLTNNVADGPLICDQNSNLQCYRPAATNILKITKAAPSMNATISVSGSPLTLVTNGSSASITIINTSNSITALNIASNFVGTALEGNVFETGNTCATLAPLSSCTLTFTPAISVVPQTSFPIQGTNTNLITAAIQVDAGASLTTVSPSSGAASGGTGVTLTGTGLTGTTDITFDGISATSINVVNSTTVTAVTPPHAVGAVDVTITTPSGTATQTNAYTYVTTSVGQAAHGGIIACLNGSNNLIAAAADNSSSIEWGGAGSATSATSTTDGAANTATIVASVGGNGGTPYAAQLCSAYEVDSLGNTPCESGNTCYNDWFLPAGNNVTGTGQLNCLYTNRVAIGGFTSSPYWSSTEIDASFAWTQNFLNGTQNSLAKSATISVRCVRVFTP